jgi:hypothetical protein
MVGPDIKPGTTLKNSAMTSWEMIDEWKPMMQQYLTRKILKKSPTSKLEPNPL